MGEYKHGYSGRGNTHILYTTWLNIKARCNNKKNPRYSDYGVRGISVCDEWESQAEVFISWCLANNWSQNLQIDRINNDGNYEPKNCRFITIKEQQSNKRKRKDSGKYPDVRKHNNKYKAVITANSKKTHIGMYSNPIDASVARDSYIINNNLTNKLTFVQPLTRIL